MRLGLVYLPDEQTSTACVALSERLVHGGKARVVLGTAKLAHVTVLHVESAEDPKTFWDEARALPSELPLSFVALAFLRYDTPYNAPPAPAATMAWLIVHPTMALRDVEQRALALPFVVRSEVTTGNGDRFQPHVTTAIWEGGIIALSEAPELATRAFVGRLALGVIGPNGVYERTLFSA